MNEARATIIASVIAAIATIIAAVIGVTMQKQNVALQEENSSLQAENTESMSEISELRDRITEMENIITTLQNENTTAQDGNTSLQDENASLQDENAQLRSRILELEAQISAPSNDNLDSDSNMEDTTDNSTIVELADLQLITSDRYYHQKTSDGEYVNSYTFDSSYRAYATYNLDNHFSKFEAILAASPSTESNYKMVFEIYLDYELAFQKKYVVRSMEAVHISLDLNGVKTLSIQTDYVDFRGIGYCLLSDTRITQKD